MKTAKVVIGANYGDEGKGLITDYLASQDGNAVVVRFNGGAQAGHTVQTPDGSRHVFSHIGAGAFAGAVTYLSRYFVCNPLLFRKEYDLLSALTAVPQIHVSPAAAVTTPYDMMINQIAEESRGARRHGSCGMGFGETIERSCHAQFLLDAATLADKKTVKALLALIRRDWVPARLKALGISDIPKIWMDRLESAGIVEKFLEDSAFFSGCVTVAPAFLRTTTRPVIFEGAQGLMLDQEYGCFPHVTRSHTGLRNVCLLALEAGIESLDVTYVTRAYLTRHGAGPLAHELQGPPEQGVQDTTNVVNDWQGKLRYAYLDVDSLAKFIAQDLAAAGTALEIAPGLAVTCLDQMGELVTYAQGDSVTTGRAAGFLDLLQKKTGVRMMLTSHGPTRATIVKGRADGLIKTSAA